MPKLNRSRWLPYQREILRREWAITDRPSPEKMSQIAADANMHPSRVKVIFLNLRQARKCKARGMVESDSEEEEKSLKRLNELFVSARL
ncbi:hypothetical protein SISSUDRAFT_1045920 [Sistotremastrum suecicum HHB10207 ss-3]|uniref:Homeobox domain-containing protein n=1 Tax=Sistotremastrum suecicum HHB10207 ss-3 TaxID=1314776 RepID=A0A166E377_9AGAM|nr:hypothetical protein SISSUDRAFT_1045920 [Sistotremastrum suecicum HHB10207 ss-3]